MALLWLERRRHRPFKELAVGFAIRGWDLIYPYSHPLTPALGRQFRRQIAQGFDTGLTHGRDRYAVVTQHDDAHTRQRFAGLLVDHGDRVRQETYDRPFFLGCVPRFLVRLGKHAGDHLPPLVRAVIEGNANQGRVGIPDGKPAFILLLVAGYRETS